MDKAEFEKLASFNKFQPETDEAERIFAELNRTLNFLQPLADADFGDTPIMVWAESVVPVYREDRAEKHISREEILAGAPDVVDNSFAVPRVAD